MSDGVVWHKDLGDVLSIAASSDGKFVYASNFVGHLYCLEPSHHSVIAEWKPEDTSVAAGNQEPAIFTSLSAAVFSDDAYLITAIDKSGLYLVI